MIFSCLSGSLSTYIVAVQWNFEDTGVFCIQLVFRNAALASCPSVRTMNQSEWWVRLEDVDLSKFEEFPLK